MPVEYPYTHRFNHLREISNPKERIDLNAMLIEANALIGAAGDHLSEPQRKDAFEVFAKAYFEASSASLKRQQFHDEEVVRDIIEQALNDLLKPKKGGRNDPGI